MLSSSPLTLSQELSFPLWAVPEARQDGSCEALPALAHTCEDRPALVLRPPHSAQEHSSASPPGLRFWISVFFLEQGMADGCTRMQAKKNEKMTDALWPC